MVNYITITWNSIGCAWHTPVYRTKSMRWCIVIFVSKVEIKRLYVWRVLLISGKVNAWLCRSLCIISFAEKQCWCARLLAMKLNLKQDCVLLFFFVWKYRVNNFYWIVCFGVNRSYCNEDILNSAIYFSWLGCCTWKWQIQTILTTMITGNFFLISEINCVKRPVKLFLPLTTNY